MIFASSKLSCPSNGCAETKLSYFTRESIKELKWMSNQSLLRSLQREKSEQRVHWLKATMRELLEVQAEITWATKLKAIIQA